MPPGGEHLSGVGDAKLTISRNFCFNVCTAGQTLELLFTETFHGRSRACLFSDLSFFSLASAFEHAQALLLHACQQVHVVPVPHVHKD